MSKLGYFQGNCFTNQYMQSILYRSEVPPERNFQEFISI